MVTEEVLSYIKAAIICIQFQGMAPCTIICPCDTEKMFWVNVNMLKQIL